MGERVVVVGAGGISNSWFGPLQKEGVEVAAIVDLRPKAAQSQAKKWQIDPEITDDLDDALKRCQPDFILNLTVPKAHLEVDAKAMRAGCHVLSEKPMAASVAEAENVVAISEETGKLVMIDQSRRWDRQHERVRRTIANGEIGTVTTVCCDFFLGAHFGGFRDEMDSPLIVDMAVHHFDLCRFFTGADPVAVYAHEFNPKGSWYAGDVAASVIFEMTNGIVFTYRGSWCAEGCHTSWNGDWRIIGDQGTLLYDHDQDPHGQSVADFNDPGFHRQLKDITVADADMPHATMHGALCEMLRFLRTGEKPQTEIHGNLPSLAMVFRAIDSSRNRARLTF